MAIVEKITFSEFYDKYPVGSQVDTDGFPSYQPYQCVDIIKLYLNECFGMPIQPYGDAKEYWNNPKILTVFDKITDGSRKEGDILVWGNDKGSFTGEAGHIAIERGGKIYNQNYNNSGRISLNNFFDAGYIGALRFKGDNNVTKNEAYKVVKWDYLHGTGLDPTGDQAEYWANRIAGANKVPPNPGAIDELGKIMNDQVNKRIQEAYEKGKKEGNTGNFTPVAEVNGKPTLYTKS